MAGKKRWLLVLWSLAAGDGTAHADDWAWISEKVPAGGVAELLGREGEFLRLRFGNRIVRARPFSQKELPTAPRFEPGELVTVETSRGPSPWCSEVESIGWHHAKRCFVYLLRGKSKRYWEADLVASVGSKQK